MIFIEQYYKQLKFWIITGTPTSEIEIITKNRDIASFSLESMVHLKTKNIGLNI